MVFFLFNNPFESPGGTNGEMVESIQIILWVIFLASIVHVLEEYFAGFVKFTSQIGPFKGMTTKQFIFINSLMFLLEILAIIINMANVIFTLSVAGLIFFNALIHIGGSIHFKRYFPGIISAIVGYIPISLVTIFLFQNAGISLSPATIVLSFLLGMFWMVIPFSYQGLRIAVEHRRQAIQDLESTPE
jgi:hypothetical protein